MRCRMVWRAVIPISSFPHHLPPQILNRAGVRMPRLFCRDAAILTMRSVIALGLFWAVSASPARAEDAAAGACSVTDVNMTSPDQGTVTIACSGLSEAFGRQFADVLTRILKDRLDPQAVVAKLDEVDRVPQEGVARTVDESQR